MARAVRRISMLVGVKEGDLLDRLSRDFDLTKTDTFVRALCLLEWFVEQNRSGRTVISVEKNHIPQSVIREYDLGFVIEKDTANS